MNAKKNKNDTPYCFIDIDLKTRQIIGWGRERKETVEVHLGKGFHRLFLTLGQFNKFEKSISEVQSGKPKQS